MSVVISEPVETSPPERVKSEPTRVADVEQKHRAISEFLQANGYDALLLTKHANFAWFTSGGDCFRWGSSDASAALFITPEARVVVTNNAESARIFDCELPELGFQLKERPWQEPWELLLKDLCRSRVVAGDNGFGSTQNVSAELAAMRRVLSPLECQRIRILGRFVAHAVEATARNCAPGRSEAKIAGEVAHRMLKRQVIPMRIQVAADGKTEKYRNWKFGSDPVERYCTISAIGRQHGLCLGASRTVCFGDVPAGLENAHHRAALIHATGMFFSQAGWEIGEVWKRVRRIYEKFGCGNEWRMAPPAEVIGYEVCEEPVIPDSAFRFSAGTALHWHPSVNSSVLGDSVLISEKGTEILTPMENWPRLTAEVKGAPVYCPEILRKPASQEEAEDVFSMESADSVLEFNIDDSFLG